MSTDDETGPEQEALLADSVGLALLVVLETLSPAERLAFVLHDMFALPFEEIASIVGALAGRDASAREPCAATCAGRDARVGRRPVGAAAGRRRVPRRSRAGDFDALVAVLDPDVVFRVDRGSLPVAARLPAVVRGPEARGERHPRARRSVRRVRAAGRRERRGGAVVAPATHAVAVIGFTVAGGRIVEIDLIADADKLRGLAVDA